MTEIQKNESLYLFNSTEGNQTILEYISAKLCPGNCSGHGNCTIGRLITYIKCVEYIMYIEFTYCFDLFYAVPDHSCMFYTTEINVS